MSFYKFNKDDLYHNTIQAHPKQEFFIYDGNVYWNKRSNISGSFTGSVGSDPGFVSLY